MITPSSKAEFPGAQGFPLAARLDLPIGRPRGYALFAHCFTCGKDVVSAARIARGLTGFGLAVLRFDFTGLGGSGGDFANTDFSSNVEDLVRAADFLRTAYAAPTLLVGHSLGGAAVLAAAHRIPEVRAVATLAAPADPAHAAGVFGGAIEAIRRDGDAQVSLAGRTFRIRREFLDDIAEQPQQERLRTLNAALLVMHSPVDETVGIDNARRIFDTARHPKSFVAVDGADHLLSKPDDAEYVAGVLAAWAGRYALERPADPPPAEGVVVVAENGEGPYGQQILSGVHRLAADEPEPVGNDTGPSPYDLLLAALGACTSMTVRMYADRKQWALDQVTVQLQHAKVHAKDCAECETKVGTIDRIDRSIRLDGDLDATQRARLLEIADKCPVHRTLHSEVIIETTEAQPG